MTALVSAPYLGQTVFVSHFRCLFECSQENQMEGFYCFMNNSDKFSQMSFHDVRYQLSVTEGLNISGFCRLQHRWLSCATRDYKFVLKSQEVICESV